MAKERYDLTDIARIAFMFNGGQSPAFTCQKPSTVLIHSSRLNQEKYPEPCFPAPQLYLLSHTVKGHSHVSHLNSQRITLRCMS